MVRPLRIEYPGAFYHVLNRGQRREPIVADARDRERFLWDLERMAGLFRVVIHSYCLMTNHYHVILETPEGEEPGSRCSHDVDDLVHSVFTEVLGHYDSLSRPQFFAVSRALRGTLMLKLHPPKAEDSSGRRILVGKNV